MKAAGLTVEGCEATAQKFLQVADSIGECDLLMRGLIADGSAIREEREAIDNFGLHALDVIRALRALAMRLDRAALIKYLPEE